VAGTTVRPVNSGVQHVAPVDEHTRAAHGGSELAGSVRIEVADSGHDNV
jgi:hypothetical protein